MKPKKIINNPVNAVEEFLEGLLLQYPNQLQKVKDFNVILRRNDKNEETNKVQLVSGGGSGHEPSHAGWCGQGMLSAAICGGIFASPSVSTIQAGLRALAQQQEHQKTDILLIIKNYTGDRLNFGVAAEQSVFVNTKMVVVADDCALPRTKGITGARGVAGTVLVHKVAGAAAQRGDSLEEVTNIANAVCQNMGSLGIALDCVTVPGADQVNDRLADDETIEIGLGIHGEAGLSQSKILSADQMAHEMISKIQSYGRMINDELVPMFETGDELVVLVNNLGGTSNFEMSILARSCVNTLENEYGVTVTRVLVGAYMTSFDMHGASLTVLNVTDHKDIITLLDAPTTAPAWQGCDVWKRDQDSVRPSSLHIEIKSDSVTPALPEPPLQIEDWTTKATAFAKAAAQKLVDSESLLTKYDTIVGDGDCGITMKRGGEEILKRSLKNSHPVPFFVDIADAVASSMGGTSGILLELMFRKMASVISKADQIDSTTIATAFSEGVEAVSLYGGAKVGARTMLDALVPAATELLNSGNLVSAAKSAREGADSTASMKAASAGRSNYLSEDSLVGTPDPGATAVALVLESIANNL